MKKKKLLWLIILIVSLVLCSLSILHIYNTYKPENTDYKEQYTKPATSSDDTISADVTTNEASENIIYAENPINFDKLLEDNPDIYAWIKVPGTDVDYPVLQSGEDKDDFFYLNHDVLGNYSSAGSIYSEKQNAKDFSDPVTLIYGHNMLNGSMFASLLKFQDEKFFKKHDKIYVYLPNRKLTYKIYSAYVYDDRHILNSFNFKDITVVDEYFKFTLNPTSMTRQVRADVSLTKDDTILTLSTCTNGRSDTRYLVQGVLFADEPTR